MKNFKKLSAAALAVAMLTSMAMPAFAADVNVSGGTGAADVVVNAEATTFKVIVPLHFEVNVDAKGVVTTATNKEIHNLSYGAVKVSNVVITGRTNAEVGTWKMVDFSTAMNKEKVGEKKLGFMMNTDVTGVDGALVFTTANWPKIDGTLDEAAPGVLPIAYDAVLPAQNVAINAAVADVVFTIDWYTAD